MISDGIVPFHGGTRGHAASRPMATELRDNPALLPIRPVVACAVGRDHHQRPSATSCSMTMPWSGRMDCRRRQHRGRLYEINPQTSEIDRLQHRTCGDAPGGLLQRPDTFPRHLDSTSTRYCSRSDQLPRHLHPRPRAAPDRGRPGHEQFSCMIGGFIEMTALTSRDALGFTLRCRTRSACRSARRQVQPRPADARLLRVVYAIGVIFVINWACWCRTAARSTAQGRRTPPDGIETTPTARRGSRGETTRSAN